MWNTTGMGLEFKIMSSVVDLQQAITIATKEGCAPELRDYLVMELRRSLAQLKEDARWLEENMQRHGLLLC